ncbi:MAG: isoprenylcysteine carboxylmethyltransferase family protein [Acidobacteriota bacterium]
MAIRLFALLRAAFFSTVFVSLWTWFFPRWIAGGALQPRWSVVPIVLLVLGGAIMLRCVWDFAWTGRGTPMPLDPPRRLVVTGLYRYVRNPMYVGMGIALVGEARLLPTITREMLLLAAGAWIAVTEEPNLRQLFGDDYLEYSRHVRRWIPRMTPYRSPSG